MSHSRSVAEAIRELSGLPPPPRDDPYLQRRVGNYKTIRKLGEGGMGIVYQAQHLHLKRSVAIKFLRSTLSGSPELVHRFCREAHALDKLRSDHVVRVEDFGWTAEGDAYLMMEFVDGISLREVLRAEGRLGVSRAANLMMQVCRGLMAAHAAEIVHRDLKPDNFLVTQDQSGAELLKILDFGIAKVNDSSVHRTRTGVVLGSPCYMPPEQFKGSKVLDARADIYSVGAILYELLSGEKPLRGNSRDDEAAERAGGAPLPLHVLRPDLPIGLVRAVERALEADPANRPRTAAELCDELAPHVERPVSSFARSLTTRERSEG